MQDAREVSITDLIICDPSLAAAAQSCCLEHTVRNYAAGGFDQHSENSVHGWDSKSENELN